MKIAVIGAGIGGLTAALALVQAGFTVEVYERAPALVDLGAGVTLAPNATRVLFHLGLGPAVLDTVTDQPIDEYRHYRSGAVLRRVQQRANGAAHSSPHIRVHRWDLQEAMVTRLGTVAPGSLRLGWRLEGLTPKSGCVTMSFDGGRRIEADLVVAADGIRSRIRDVLFGTTSPMFTGFVAWRGLVPTADLPPSLQQAVVSFGGGRHLRRYLVRRGELVNFVAYARRDGWESEGWTIPASQAEFVAEFADFDAETRALLARPLHGPLFKWGLFGRQLLPSWSAGRVVLLGDAAHPMLPFIGQGGGMAIEDAMVLARALPLELDPERAFARYEKARRERVLAITERAANQGRMYEGEPTEDRLKGDERTDIFSYDAVSCPI